MPRRKVLLVGGAGYIGSHCALTLHNAGIDTVIYDDLSAGFREAAIGPLIVGDVRDRERLTQVLEAERFDAVMHFAALIAVGESVRKPLGFFDINVGGTLSLLSAMAASHLDTLVFSSTCAIYGNPVYLPLDEQHPVGPVSPYGLTKWMVEQVLDECRSREGFNITTLRYFNAAGADPSGLLGEMHSPETHLIPLALEAATGRRVLQIFGDDYPTPDGTALRDYVHVHDLAQAHYKALLRMWDGSPGRPYNLGTGKGHSVMDVIRSAERITGLKVPTQTAKRRDGDSPALYAANSLATKELEWAPVYLDLDPIVEGAWKWMQAPRYGRST